MHDKVGIVGSSYGVSEQESDRRQMTIQGSFVGNSLRTRAHLLSLHESFA